MYHISKYIVVQDLDENNKLLYSTLSTSIIELDNNSYNDIFVLKKFNDYKEDCKQLEEMGFLFCGDCNAQLQELEKIRKEIVETDHGITAITIAPTMDCNARCYYCRNNYL